MSFVAAFLGYWSLVVALINLVVHIYLHVSLKDPILLNLPMTILSPTIISVTEMKSRAFLERSMLASAIILLASLTIIRLLPLLSYLPFLPYLPMAPSITRLLTLLDTRDLLHCTYGLHHLNFNSAASNFTYPACSPFFQMANTTLNETALGNDSKTFLFGNFSLTSTVREPGDACDF